MKIKNQIQGLIIISIILFMSSCTANKEFSDRKNETKNLMVYVEENNVSIMEQSGIKIEKVTNSNWNDFTYKSPKWNPTGNKIGFIKIPQSNSYSAELIVVNFSLNGVFYYEPFLKEDDVDRISTKFLDSRKETLSLSLDKLNQEGFEICKNYEIAFDWVSENDLILLCQENDLHEKTANFCMIPINKIGQDLKNITCETFFHPEPENPFSHLNYSPQKKVMLLSSDIQGNVYLYSSGEIDFMFEGVSPTWSPDGKKISYVKDADLYIYDFSNNKHTKLYEHGENVSTPFDLTDEEFTIEWYKNILVDYSGMTWGSDSKELYFTARRYPVSVRAIYKIDLDTLQIYPITVDDSYSPDFYSFPLLDFED